MKKHSILIILFVFSIVIPNAFSMTYVVYDKTVPNTYEINHKLTDKDEIYVIRQKANELNPIYYEINERNEEKERLLAKKFRRFNSWVKNKFYIGYDEDVFGSKNHYLNWKKVPNSYDEEDFHPTKGYEEYKGKTYLERIEKYSVK